MMVMDSERLIWSVLAKTGRVDGFLDLNSLDGAKVKAVKSTGIRPALGISTSIPEKDATGIPSSMIIKDMTKRFDLNNCFELVTCVGIIAGLPFDKREVFVGNVARHCERWLVIDNENWLVEALTKQGFHTHEAVDKNILLMRRNESS